MVFLCLRLKNEEEAFRYVEKSRSRALVDMLATKRIKPTVKLTDELSSLIEEEERYLAKLREIQTRHLRNRNITIEMGEIDRIRQGLKDVYNKISNIDPEYVLLRSGEPASLVQVRQMLLGFPGAV
jgi:hypothetical protein